MIFNCEVNIVDAIMGAGKAQTLDSLVLTKDGFKKMKDIIIGTEVFGEDGLLHNVIGIFPQGEKDVYKVTFSDRTSTLCCKEHLWTYQLPQDKKKNIFRTNSLEEIMKMDLYKTTNRGDKNWQIYIPITKPIEFTQQDELPLDPYVLGVLLGDGSFTGTCISITNAEKDIIEKIETKLKILNENLYMSLLKDNITYNIYDNTSKKTNHLTKIIRNLGLLNHNSSEKFIPLSYKLASVKDRISLLQGLIDTNGCINKGMYEYSTSSKQLRDDFVFLVQSLGGTATVSEKKDTLYIYKGEKRTGLLNYRIFVKMSTEIKICSSLKHLSKYKIGNTLPHRTIRKIEYIGKDECQCILVNNPTHLYLTNDFIVTHNTQSIMNLINESDKKFLVITPYLDEITRYKSYCKDKNFKSPKFESKKTKLDNLKNLIGNGENIVSTHALFQKFDNELIDMCRAQNYTLIMDEVANVIDEYYLTKQDFEILKNTYVDIDPDTKQLKWKDKYSDYYGKFDNEKRLCELGSLVCYGDNLMVWLFPIETFNSFRSIYILTYEFKMQMQKYYYDYYGLEYKYWSVDGDKLENYHLEEYEENKNYLNYDYRNLIHICDNEKLNMIGDRENDLSKSWYNRNKNNSSMKVLKNNLVNFFRNVRNDYSSDNIWTTFKDFQNALKGSGYTKGFLPLNSRATNEYKDRTSIAYPVNRYLNPFVKNFFSSNNIEIDEDGYALSEMLQFIWRGAIREGKEIYVYVPSVRMRNLLKKWIEENSLEK